MELQSTTNDYQRELDVALQAASEAGRLLVDKQNEARQIAFKGEADLVTDADRASEELIARLLLEAYPGDALLAEESGYTPSSLAGGRMWVVDPLDGTTNYAHRFPLYAVSIALVVDDVVQVGVVTVPPLGETFEAVRGGGARLNGAPVAPSGCHELGRALLVTGFPYDPGERQLNLDHWNRFVMEAQAVRRIGSAAYDLCCVACGRFDGYWERGPSAWDLAAGSLLVSEAGGIVSSYNGEPFDLHAREILACAPGIHQEMMRRLAK
jgi:myo-inositol-1(or 4)-monophosphatase